MRGRVRLHGLQGVRQDVGLGGVRTARNADQTRWRGGPSQCDPRSLYVQLSLDGIMLFSKARKRDVAGNNVSEDMMAAEERLEMLSDKTIAEAERCDWAGETQDNKAK